MAVTYKTLMETFDGIDKLINTQHEIEKARPEGRKLYKMGLELIKGELANQQIDVDELCLEHLISKIEAILCTPGFQGHAPLQRTLSKAYTIFIELRWYIPWKQHKDRPVRTDLRKKYIETARTLDEILRKRDDSIEARFEYRCAKQGAKRLEPDAALWKDYLLDVADVLVTVPDVKSGSISAAWAALKKLAYDLRTNHKASWYHFAYVLRWDSIKVATVQEFQDKIGDKIDLCHRKGKNLSNTLAFALMRIIKNSECSDVRDAAFHGRGSSPGLKHLIKWFGWDKEVRWFNRSIEEIRAKLGKSDRFSETRQMASRFLMKIMTSNKANYSPYRTETKGCLLEQAKELETQRKKPKYKQARDSFRATLESCLDEKMKIGDQLEEKKALTDYLQSTKASTEQIQKLELEQEELMLKQKAVQKEQLDAEANIEKLELVESSINRELMEEQQKIEKYLKEHA